MPKAPALLLALCLLAVAGQATAQDSQEARITEVVLAQGFENVGVELAENRVTVWFENRKYRYDMTAIGVVARVVGAELDSGVVLELIP